MKLNVFVLLMLNSLSCFSQNTKELKNISVQTIDGKEFLLNETNTHLASVFIFLLPDCPASQNYTLTLNQFSENYKSKNVVFYGVFPSFVKREEIIQFQKDYHIKFPLLMDANQKLLAALKAHIAPEVVVMDRQMSVLYSGRIDDWMYAVGKKRTVITHHELQDALNEIVEGKKVTVSKTNAVGCIID